MVVIQSPVGFISTWTENSKSHLNQGWILLQYMSIVTWRLKAGIVGPEETFTARQRLGEEVSAATDTQATIDELFRTMFSILSAQSCYKRRELRFGNAECWVKLSSARELEKRWRPISIEGIAGRQFWMRVGEVMTSARDTEEFPLLEAAARERLLKTQQDGKSCGDL
jgi:hypothetical protein